MSRKKHDIPLGTLVSFEGDAYVYRVVDSQELLYCEPGCSWDHDCYEEPYITVSLESRTAFPLSKLSLVFDKNGHGHSYHQKNRC